MSITNLFAHSSTYAANAPSSLDRRALLALAVPGHPLLKTIIDRVRTNCQHMLNPTSSQKPSGGSLLPGGGSSGMKEESSSLTKAVSDTGFKNTIEQTGPGMLTKVVFEYLNSVPSHNDECLEASSSVGSDSIRSVQELHRSSVIFAKEVFSPVPNTVCVDLSDSSEASVLEIERVKQLYVTESTVAIHWWQKSWYKK
eukprot:gene23249-29454_t